MKILILEDDVHVAEFIKKIVLEEFPESKCYQAYTGKDALDIARESEIDLMIVDVELDEEKKILGIDYALEISLENSNTDFIVISEHDKYAIKSYDIHPYFYIKKPIEIGILRRILNDWEIERMNQFKHKRKKMQINTANGINIINVDDIICLERCDKKIRIVTTKKTYEVSDSLKNFEDKLGSNFYKTYQSFIVNTDMIDDLTMQDNRSWEIGFKENPTKAILSRYKSKDFFEKFSKFNTIVGIGFMR